LYFLVPELSDPGGFGGTTVVGVDVVSALPAKVSAVPVDVVYFEVELVLGRL